MNSLGLVGSCLFCFTLKLFELWDINERTDLIGSLEVLHEFSLNMLCFHGDFRSIWMMNLKDVLDLQNRLVLP